MLHTVLARIATSFLLIAIVTTGSFFLTTLSPRHPEVYRLGHDAPASAVRELREQLGLDRPRAEQFGHWLSGVARGDLGRSYVTDRPVMDDLATRVPRTLSLLTAATLLAAVIGFALGISAALVHGGWADRLLSGVAALMQAIPGFWLAILLVTGFALMLSWFPATGYVAPTRSLNGWLASITLPSIALALPSAAAIGRQLRAALIRETAEEYLRCAIATGASRREAVVRYALRNAMGPTITILGYQVVVQLSTSVVIENIFAIEGLGSMALDAVFRGDTPALLAAVLAFAVLVLVVNLLVDLAYGWFNPRVQIT